jgi:protein pelota
MRIVKREHGLLKLFVECQDDLWNLAYLCTKGRSLAMLGNRRDQSTGSQEGERAKVAERKPAWIKLAIENHEFHYFSGDLRVHGTIEEAPFDKGSHHTHLIEIRDEIEISCEDGFPKVDLDLIDNAVKSAGRAKVVILVVENDEVILYEVTGRGMREVTTWTMRGGGKYQGGKLSETVTAAFFKKVKDEFQELQDEEVPVVVAGPGLARERLLPMLHSKVTKLAPTSIGGRAAANEVIRDGLAGGLLSDHALVRETELLEEAWRLIAIDGPVAYGKEMLNKALEEGAVETLLISAEVLRDDDFWGEYAKKLDVIGAKLIQCSTDHDSGQQLLGMGGAIALLRFRM